MPDPRKPDLSRIALGVAGFAVASTALAGFLLAAGSRLWTLDSRLIFHGAPAKDCGWKK